MPTYEYACKACGHRLEAVQKFTDNALTECTECGGTLRKVFGAPGIVLKGSGFYKTDTRAQDKRSSSDAAGTKGADSSKSDTKTDTSTKTGAGSTSNGTSESSKPSSDKPAKESKTAASTAS